MRKKTHTSCWFGHSEIIRTVRTGKNRPVDEEQSDIFLLPTILNVQKKNEQNVVPVFSRIHLARFIFRTFHGTYSTWVNGGVKKVCLFSMFIFSMIHPSHCFHCLIVAIYFCCFKGPLAISKCDVSHFFCVLEKINK